MDQSNITAAPPMTIGSQLHFRLSLFGRAPFWIVNVSSVVANSLIVLFSVHPLYISGVFKWFVLNTAIWDGLFSLIVCTFSVYEIFNPNTSVVYCTLLDHFRSCVHSNTIMALTLALGNRYMAICHPNRYELLSTPTRVACFLVGINGALVLVNSGRLVELGKWYRNPTDYQGTMAVRTCGLAVTFSPNVLIAIVVVLGTLISGVYFTTKTLREIRHLQRMVSARSDAFASSVVHSRRVLVALLLQAMALISCTIPIWIMYMVFVRHGRKDNTETAKFVFVGVIFLCLPMLLDGLLVFSLMPQYRNTLRYVLLNTIVSQFTSSSVSGLQTMIRVRVVDAAK